MKCLREMTEGAGGGAEGRSGTGTGAGILRCF